MRNTALMNGALLGFGLGFILASLALYRVASNYIPQYANTWYIQGIGIVGGVGLIIGIIFEVMERMKTKKEEKVD
jgi:heme/copper-type cytochrome/quinol oxidase subunit 4